MTSVRSGFSLQTLNGALAAGTKLGRGEALSRSDRQALTRLQGLPGALDEVRRDPILRDAVLAGLGGSSSPVPLGDNPVLASALSTLRTKPQVTLEDLQKVVAFAGARLSHAEDAAISSTIAYLGLKGTASPEVVSALSPALGALRAERERVESKASWGRRVFTALAGGVVGTLAASVAFWIFGGPVAQQVGAQAAQAVQLGLTAGGLLAGTGGASLLGRTRSRQADEFGVKD